MVDYHLHFLENFLTQPQTTFDQKAKLLEGYLDEAEKKGIKVLGFSDHAYLFKQAKEINLNDRQMSKMLFDLDEYVKLVRNLKRDGIKILLGLEVDYHLNKEQELQQFIETYQKKYSFDYFVGSVHSIDDWEVDIDPGLYKEKMLLMGPGEVYRRYYQVIEKLAKNNWVKIIGHLDLVKVFGQNWKEEEYFQVMNRVLDLIKQQDKIVEINTNGFNKVAREQYPSRWILEKCFEKGIKLTFSSDAHSAERVGEGFEKIKEMIEPMGYSEIYYCQQQKQWKVEL